MTLKPVPYTWPADTPLLAWTETDSFTIGHSLESTFVFGQTGSGKSSGPGKNIALAMLRAGYGFWVTTAKVGDEAEWRELAARAGRTRDLVVVRPDGPHRLNVLDYAYGAGGRGAANADNLTGLVMRMLAARDRGRGQPTDPYWTDNARMALTNLIDLLAGAGEPITFPNIVRALASLPESLDEARSPDWARSSYANALIDRAVVRSDFTAAQENDLSVALDWALGGWPRLYEKTRSGIRSTLESLIYPWQRNHMATLFGTDTTFVPEDTYTRGAIVIVALDVKTYLEAGQLAQVLMKTIFQQAIERRDTALHPRPVCLFMDEYQNFVTDYDPLFQATARSSRAAVVALSQNVDSLASRFSGPTGKSEALALLGNFGTRLFCNNDHIETNEIASKTIGEEWTKQSNVTADLGAGGGMSAGTSDQRRRRVEPLAFAQLRKGGPEAGNVVEAYCFRSGRPFRTKTSDVNAPRMNHVKVVFPQNPE